ncbi:MAG TPA: hypothetical protein VJR23_09665 [Candidatus Acidoferrales bacterium]|nr:hypothetical protein [Candidatus Acidoferrales bacterium]
MLAACICAGCGGSGSQSAKSEAAAQAAPAVPQDIQAAADAALGSETDVLLFGDLAKNGKTELLAVNQLKVTPQGVAPGTLVTRAAVIEKDDGTWKEIFMCDEHLKNSKGYLGGIPLAPVNSWRLQYEQDATKGLVMYFTPLAKPQGGYVQTIGVRWNPKAERYQSLDRTFEQFLNEVETLETPESQIR